MTDHATRILRCLAAHGIPSRPADAAAGPRLDVWRVVVPAAAMERALRLQTAMEAALDVEGVALRQRGRCLHVEVPRRGGCLVRLEDIGPALGVTATGRRVGIHLDAIRPHAIVAGMTGSGKSELLRTLALIESRRADTDLVLIDLKGGAFDELAERGHHVATDGPAALAALRWAAARIGRPADGRRVAIIVDEAAHLSAHACAAAQDIAERGRAAGLRLVLATQYVRGDVLGRRITTAAGWRICGRVFDVPASRLVLGQAGAERLTGGGDFLLSESGAPAVRFQAALAGPGAWQHARAVEPLGIEAGAPTGLPERVAWAAERIAERGRVSAAEIREQFKVGTDAARRIRDEAVAYLPTQEAPLLAFPVGRAGASR